MTLEIQRFELDGTLIHVGEQRKAVQIAATS
jgi:hypothetical protein